VFLHKRPFARTASLAVASVAAVAGSVASAVDPPATDPGVPTAEDSPTTTVPETPPTAEPPPTAAPPTATPPTTVAPVEPTPAPDQPVDTLPAPPDSSAPSNPAAAPETGTTTTTVPPPPAPAPRNVRMRGNQLQYVLATIRYFESRGDYTVGPNRGGASGAYQYIPKTWANYAEYPEAYLAPPWVQDERAAADVAEILRTWHNDISMVPIIWYYPAAASDPSLLDVVPMPEAGNVLTVREYQRRWLDAFVSISGKPLPPGQYPLPPGLELLSGIPPVLPEPAADSLSMAFPLLGPSAVAPPPACAEGQACDGPRPAIVFGRTLQPVLAVADGVVTDVELADRLTGEVSVTVTDVAGRSYRYGGLNNDTPGTDDGSAPAALRVSGLAEIGRTVRAGQIIGFVGNSDPVPLADGSGAWPHLRLTVTDLAGSPLDAEGPVVAALFRQLCTTGIGQWSVPPNPSTAEAPLTPVVVESDDGSWWITGNGQVVAVGDAALIHPTDACQWQPPTPHGPGAGGNTTPAGFTDEILLPVDVWLAVLDDDAVRPSTPWRRGS
jgi:hypothetical protein